MMGFHVEFASAAPSREVLLHQTCDAAEPVVNFLIPLSTDYPGIEEWYAVKVLPGIVAGTRKVFTYERDGQIAAIGIAKSEGGENKICTVRVDPRYYGRGIGLRVFDDAMSWLGTSKPLLTVSATKLPLFARIFDYYGFEMSGARNHMYVRDSTELGFNGALKSETLMS